jgi:hypothetical protein
MACKACVMLLRNLTKHIDVIESQAFLKPSEAYWVQGVQTHALFGSPGFFGLSVHILSHLRPSYVQKTV